MAEDLKDSGTVTAMSVIGLVFGLIGMLSSFIPCIGSLAFYIGIPAAIISGLALGIAYSQNAKRTFAIVALTISLIGVVISGWQYLSIMSAGIEAKKELERMSRPSIYNPAIPPAPAPPPGPAPQIKVQNETKQNTEEAEKIFHDIYAKLIVTRNLNEINRLKNTNDWKKIEINLHKGAENVIKIEGPVHGIVVVSYNKGKKVDRECKGLYDNDYMPNNLTNTGRMESYYACTDEGDKELCRQFKFEPSYKDGDAIVYLPAQFANKYSISLQKASIK